MSTVGWPVKVFCPDSWVLDVRETHRPLLARALTREVPPYGENVRDHFLCLSYFGGEVVRCEDIGSANLILLPFWYEAIETNAHLIARVNEAYLLGLKYRKPVFIQSHGKDVFDPLTRWKNVPNSFRVLYYNLMKSRGMGQGVPFPYFVPDFLSIYCDGKWSPSQLHARPMIGFCGVAAPIGLPFGPQVVKDCLRLLVTYLGPLGRKFESAMTERGSSLNHAYRARALLHLAFDNSVDTEFVLRNKAGMVSKEYYQVNYGASYNREYYTSILNSDYTVCARGTENYSIRFFEVFCLGRIPILVDTDCVLPFADKIDYEECCVIVPSSKIGRVGRYVLDFHSRKRTAELIRIQRNNRRVWERFFTATGFIRELAVTTNCSGSVDDSRVPDGFI